MQRNVVLILKTMGRHQSILSKEVTWSVIYSRIFFFYFYSNNRIVVGGLEVGQHKPEGRWRCLSLSKRQWKLGGSNGGGNRNGDHGKELGARNQMNFMMNSMWERSKHQTQTSTFMTEWVMESFAQKKNVGRGAWFLMVWWQSTWQVWIWICWTWDVPFPARESELQTRKEL